MIIQRITLDEPIYTQPDEKLSVAVVDKEKCVVTITRGDVSVSAEMGCTVAMLKYGEWVQA